MKIGINQKHVLKLFVAGRTSRSISAINNLESICCHDLNGRYELEVIDVLQHPEVAVAKDVHVTPTLIRELPEPVGRILGDLSEKERILIALQLTSPDD